MCLSYVYFSELVNGEGSSPIVPQRGLSQSDPLSR